VQPINFVHITDLHIGNPAVEDDHLYSDTTANLRAIMADISALHPRPSFIVASGDLTNQGDEGSYRNLKALMSECAPDIPVLYTLGNHDKREGYYRVMENRTDGLHLPCDHSAVIDGIHVILLDTSTPGRVGGHFEAGQLDWLRGELDNQPGLPKLLVMHHAPALDFDKPDMEWESLSFADTEALRALLDGRRDVIGILCGHIHYDRVSHWYGIPVVVGIGQHAATDVVAFSSHMRMLAGASFVLGTARDSGLTLSFVPQPSDRRELVSHDLAGMTAIIRRIEAAATAAE
jgi:Icc protein